MALGGSIPDKSFPVLVYNMERADEFVNSDALVFVDRFDKNRKTITALTLEAQAAYRLASDAPQGNYGLGVVYEESNWTYFYNNEYWGLSDTFDLSQLPYTATEADPNNDTANLMVRSNASQSYVQVQDIKAQGEVIPGVIFPLEGEVLSNGDLITTGTTHLRVTVDGKPTIVKMSPIAEGVVSALTEVGATIGSTDVTFQPLQPDIHSTLEQYGGAADYWLPDGSVNPSPTDNYPVLLKIIDAVKKIGYVDALYPNVGKILLGAGGYYFGTPYNAKEVSFIEGVGSGLAGGAVTYMVFDGVNTDVGGSAGITYHRHNTDETSISLVSSTTGSDGSKLKGVALYAINNVPTLAPEEEQLNNGVTLRARMELEDVQVINFGGHGRSVEASSSSGRRGNANLFRMKNCRSTLCGYHGLFTFGADANAGVINGEDSVSCNGNAIREASFLGNSYYGTHSSVCYRDEHYVTHDAGSGIQHWWFTSSDPADVSIEPGTDDSVWYVGFNGAIQPDTRPWTGANVMETSGAIYSSGGASNNNFYGVYTEGGSTGPVYLQQNDTLVFTANGTGVAYQTLAGRNMVTSVGAMLNPEIRNSKPQNTGEDVRFFVRDNSPFTMDFGVLDTNQLQVDMIAKRVLSAIDITGMGIGGALYTGMVHTNDPTNTAGLSRGDLYTEQGLRLGGQNGTGVFRGSISSSKYYRAGDLVIQTTTAAGQTSYKQCVTAGIGNSTAVFEDHIL